MRKKGTEHKPADDQRWFVKNEHGETFGPVPFETLKEWALDGRLAPASLISENGTAWSPVIRLPGLEMDWVAEVSPGMFYGPIHYQALKGLQKDGSIAPTAPLFVRSTGATIPRPAQTPADEAEETLAACIRQAEQTQQLLAMHVAQVTAQLAARDARPQRPESRDADFNLLQTLAQNILAAQETGKQQILDAVANAQASIAGQVSTVQVMPAQQAKNQRLLLDAIADVKAGHEQLLTSGLKDLRALVQDVKAEQGENLTAMNDLANMLAYAQQTTLGAIADAHSQTVEKTGHTIRDATAALAQDVKAGQAQTLTSGFTDIRALVQDVKSEQGQITVAVGGTVAAVMQQIQKCSDEIQTLEKRLMDALQGLARPAPAEPPRVERIYVEAEAVEVIPPEPPPAKPKPVSARTPAKTAAPELRTDSANGLSLAELEQQAQRELERLGAQGMNLFKRKK